MKKITIYLLTIILCAALAVFVSFRFVNKGTDITVSSSDETIKLDFGKEKVTNVQEGGESGLNYFISFDEGDDLNFYDDKIKTSEYYFSDLDYSIESLDHYGFLIKENHLFKYEINGIHIKLQGISGSFIEEGYYIINMPIWNDITTDGFDINNIYYYDRNSSLSDNKVSYEMLKNILGHFDNKYYKIINGEIYLKGENELEDNQLSNDYLIKIKENDGKVVVSLAN